MKSNPPWKKDITYAESIALQTLSLFKARCGLVMNDGEMRHIRDAIFQSVKSAVFRKRAATEKVTA